MWRVYPECKYRKTFILFPGNHCLHFCSIVSGKTLRTKHLKCYWRTIFFLKMLGPWRPSSLSVQRITSSSPLGCCICLFPAREGRGGWGSHSRLGCDLVVGNPSETHVEPHLTWETCVRTVTWSLTARRDTMWRPTARLNNMKSPDDCYRLLWLFHEALSFLYFLRRLSFPEVTPLSSFSVIFNRPPIIIL